MDIVFLRELRINTVIGAYDWERNIRQTVVLDIEMGTNIGPAAQDDALAKTVDYFAVSQRLTEFIEQATFELVETLAEAVVNILFEEFGVAHVKLRVAKPGAIAHARDVGVLIERSRPAG